MRGRPTLGGVCCLLGALSLLTACRVGPHYHAPVLPNGSTAQLVSLDDQLESTAMPPDAWWQLYNDSRLSELIVEALSANRDLAVAEANLSAAKAVLSGAHALRYPSTEISASGVYGRDPTTDEILELTGRSPKSTWILEDLFEASYELDLFGHVHNTIEAASARADAVTAERDAVRVVVVALTARTYAAVCALGEELAVARHSLEVVTRQADIVTHRYGAGGNSEFDVERAEALVAQVRSSIPSLEGERRMALFELAAVLGRTPTEAPHDIESCISPPRLVALIPVGDGTALIRRRPDVRRAERRLASATAQVGVATAELYPIIRLSGFYGGVATEFNQLGTNAGAAWGAGPSISWNFPNQLGARARVRQAEAGRAAELAAFDSTLLGALKETEQALTLYRALIENHASLVDARVRIHRAFDIANEQYRAGGVSNLDLLTTEQSLVAADSAVASSDAALVQGQIAVFKALGGGWGDRIGQSGVNRTPVALSQ
jgi:NodT family efflux transporter outer membrane factor (OMF) lipoprotein